MRTITRPFRRGRESLGLLVGSGSVPVEGGAVSERGEEGEGAYGRTAGQPRWMARGSMGAYIG